MRRILIGIALVVAALASVPSPASAVPPVLLLLSPEDLSAGSNPDNAFFSRSALIAEGLKEGLAGIFDVRVAAVRPTDDEGLRRAARAVSARYLLDGQLVVVGNQISLDLSLRPSEDPSRLRALVVTGTLPSGSVRSDLFRSFGSVGAAKVREAFLGEAAISDPSASRRLPPLSGSVTRTRNLPGDVVSVARFDTDLDGQPEIVVATTDSVVVYRMNGDDLVEKGRLESPGSGIFRIDAVDTDRNGIGEIVVSRSAAGTVLSDVWESNGKQYVRRAKNIPLFLRAVDLGAEGIVLIGQNPDPSTIFSGPVHRVSLSRYGLASRVVSETAFPLPAGTFIYAFDAMRRSDGSLRFVVRKPSGRLLLLAGDGTSLWDGLDSFGESDIAIDGALEADGKEGAKLLLPPRIFATDLDGDRNDEVVVVSNLPAAGAFFEGVRFPASFEVAVFAQGPDRLDLVTRVSEIDGSARDAAILRPGPGSAFRLAVVSRDRRRILDKNAEWRLLWVR